MKFRKLFWMTTITTMALLLVACGGDAPAPTAESNTSGATTLSQQATFEGGLIGGAFTVSFPDAWSHQLGESDIRLSNNADIINRENEPATLPTGTVAMSVSMTPAIDAENIPSVADLVKTFVDYSQISSPAPQFGEIEAITVDGREGAKVLGTIEGSDNMILALDLDGNIVLAIIVAPEGEINNHIDTIHAIVASVSVSPAE